MFGPFSSDTTRTSYAYGGGVEYAIPTSSFVNVFHAGSVTLKAEFLHYDLGKTYTGAVLGSTRTDGDLVRGSINYKLDLFGTGAAPVVARY